MKEVQVGCNLMHFHENCRECEALIRKMRLLDEILTSLRHQRRDHLKPFKPTPIVRNEEKVNLHLTPEDISIPSNWHRQANRVRKSLKSKGTEEVFLYTTSAGNLYRLPLRKPREKVKLKQK